MTGLERALSRRMAILPLIILAILSAAVPAAEKTATQAAPSLVLQLGHLEQNLGNPSASRDRRLAATIDKGRTVVIWDLHTGRQLRRLMPSAEKEGSRITGTIGGLSGTTTYRAQTALSPDGAVLAATGAQGLTLWNVAAGTRLHELRMGATNVSDASALAFSPDGKRIAGARSAGHGFYVWDVASGKPVYDVGSVFSGRLTSSKLYFEWIAWSPDGRHLLVPGSCYQAECSLEIHDAGNEQEVDSIKVHAGLPDRPVFSPDGKLMAMTAYLGIQIIDTASWKTLATFPAQVRVGTLSFSNDGRMLAFVTADQRRVRVIDVADGGRNVADIELPTAATGLIWSPDDRSLHVFPLQGRPFAARLDALPLKTEGMAVDRPTTLKSALTINRQAKILAVASGAGDTGYVDVWDLSSGSLTRKLSMDLLWRLTPRPDAQKLPIGARLDATLFIDPGDTLLWLKGPSGVDVWNLQRGSKEFQFPGYDDDVVALSADGNSIAVAGLDAIVVRNIRSGKELRTIGVSPRSAFGRSAHRYVKLALSATGKWLAASEPFSEKFMTRVWNVASGELVAELPNTVATSLVAFEQDERLLLADDRTHVGDGTLVVWNLDANRQAERQKRAPKTTVKYRFEGGAHEDTVRLPGTGLMALSGSDRTVRILDEATGSLLVTLISHAASTDWLAFTPGGLFDGTPGGWDVLLWRFSEEIYDVAPAEAFFNEFYRPGLLAEIIAGGRPKPQRSLADVDRRQPRVGLQVAGGTERLTKVRIDVEEAAPDSRRSTGSGVRDVRLFRNGSLVRFWKGEVGAGKTALEADIPIVAGENHFVAYAFNRDNIKSSDARASVRGAEALARPATAWVLAFGINRYANPAFNLGFSVADAQAYADQIKAGQAALGRYRTVNVVALKDEEATKANLLAALKRLAGTERGPLPKGAPKVLAQLAPAQPEDAVFIFFAGHGMTDEPRFYLVPHDLGFAGKAGQIDVARSAILRHAISDLELEAALEPMDADRIVLTIDACHSGQALEATERRRGPMNAKGLAQLAYEKGMYVITAAQSHQAALEFDQLGHGLLTYALIKEGLGKAEADRHPHDGRIDVREWLDYASIRVPQLQLHAMQDLERRGRNVAVVKGEETEADVLKRSLQQPRIFYRREPERTPFIVGGK